MRAAFPSVAYEYLWFILSIMGNPDEYITLTKKLYKANMQRIKMFVKFYTGPVFRSGVKQGDPLSMLLFAIAIEPLIRVLESLVDIDEFVGAFADDIGIVIKNWEAFAPDLWICLFCFKR